MLFVLDTSLVPVSMALVGSGGRTPEILWRGQHAEQAGSVAQISELLTQGLAAVGQPLAAVRGVAVSVGPGSFTGIKIGLAFVFGLARALKDAGPGLPMLGLSALEAAAKRYATEQGHGFGLFLPATRTHGFLSVARSGAVETALYEAGSESGNRRLAALAGDVPLGIVGRWPLLQAAAQAAKPIGRSVLEIQPTEVALSALYGMSEEAFQAFPNGFGATLPEPRYLRLSTAEERLATPKA
jgi:tRNA threonylcarbamoyladenosine biosynthesis protein TsaB